MTTPYVDSSRDEFVPLGASSIKVPRPSASIAANVERKLNPDISDIQPPTNRDPLARFSLIDATEELQALAQEQTPLLGELCLRNQTSVWYAKPNTGKTLLAIHLLREAITNGRISGSDCFYVAADDNPAGVLEKQTLLKPFGVHVIAPGLKHFSTAKLTGEIEEMIRTGAARGKFIVLDTLKKFADLMDKKNSSGFADLARRFVMAGGTLLGLAHTNKRTDKDGRPIFAGTSDILDDFDCGHTMMELPQHTRSDERIVQFDCLKRRGEVAQQVVYSYSIKDGLSYAERLGSIQELQGDLLSRVHMEADQERDGDAIAALEDCIREGITAKLDLARETAKRTRLSRHKVGAIVDRYSGEDPEKHRWTFKTVDHGRRVYRLLRRPGDPDEEINPDEVY